MTSEQLTRAWFPQKGQSVKTRPVVVRMLVKFEPGSRRPYWAAVWYEEHGTLRRVDTQIFVGDADETQMAEALEQHLARRIKRQAVLAGFEESAES